MFIMQAVYHRLIESPMSPRKRFSPLCVSRLKPEELGRRAANKAEANGAHPRDRAAYEREKRLDLDKSWAWTL